MSKNILKKIADSRFGQWAIYEWTRYRVRKPVVKNKYRLSPADFKRLKIADETKIDGRFFERNEIKKMYVLKDYSGISEFGGPINGYCVTFYDDDAPKYPGETGLYLKSYEHNERYCPNSFYEKEDIDIAQDLQIQEKLLRRINALLDNGTLKLVKQS